MSSLVLWSSFLAAMVPLMEGSGHGKDIIALRLRLDRNEQGWDTGEAYSMSESSVIALIILYQTLDPFIFWIFIYKMLETGFFLPHFHTFSSFCIRIVAVGKKCHFRRTFWPGPVQGAGHCTWLLSPPHLPGG